MNKNFTERLINSLRDAAKFDSGNLVKPQVILWPDPDKQWEVIIPCLQQKMPELLIFGDFNPEQRTGPAIWLKCMVAGALPEADWDKELTPIIYLPGISKKDLRNLANADPMIAPLMEYQYTGTLWTHRNGKEWTIVAFMQNSDEGLGLTLAQDNATKEAALKALPEMLSEKEIFYPSHVNSDFLYQLLFPNEAQSILLWMCKGNEFPDQQEDEKRQVFTSICKSKYQFIPDRKNIKSIAEKLGSRQTNWEKVWTVYKEAPKKYPEIEELLRLAKPDDFGSGIFEVPKSSWPQVNEEEEEKLRNELEDVGSLQQNQAVKKILELEQAHKERRTWVWAELGKANLALALKYLSAICRLLEKTYDRKSLKGIESYYLEHGYKIDYSAIQALACTKSEKEKTALKKALQSLYKPWVEKLTNDFQTIIKSDPSIFLDKQVINQEGEFILFVDALRFDLAKVLAEKLQRKKYKVDIQTDWTPLPSLTPTSKPYFSPIATCMSLQSNSNEFRPQTSENKDLSPHQFKVEMDSLGYETLSNTDEIAEGRKYWMEIGKIDKVGHQEQADLVRRIDELFELIEERLESIFEHKIKKVKIVTDHGWLLVPGGMPKENLPKDHIETRWGRCAILKEGIQSDLLHLPWQWNKNILIAYARGISFFKVNREYAHGGISVQECLVPIMTVETTKKAFEKITIEHKWIGLKCSIEVKGGAGCYAEIRTKYSDEKSAISKLKEITEEEKVSIFIEDSDFENQAAFIVITDKDGIILERQQTIVGE